MKTLSDPIKVILADDHEILREGIVSVLQKHTHVKIVAEASNGVQLIALTNQYIPDIILMDIKMPLMGGIEATRIIIQKHPQIGIIALSMYEDDNLILDMLEAGARGYLLKNAPKNEIIEAIDTVINQDSYFSKNISARLAKIISEGRSASKRPDTMPLSTREKQVINLICCEFTTKEISEFLHLGERTIDGYRESILKKTKANNIAGIVTYAIANKLYNPLDTDVKKGKKK